MLGVCLIVLCSLRIKNYGIGVVMSSEHPAFQLGAITSMAPPTVSSAANFKLVLTWSRSVSQVLGLPRYRTVEQDRQQVFSLRVSL